MSLLFSLLAGVIFGAGLAVSDMVNPARVLNFLDLAGHWDPTLIFVMAGGLGITALGYRLVFRHGSPICSDKFHLPGAATDRCSARWRFGAVWRRMGSCRYLPGPCACRSHDARAQGSGVRRSHADRDGCDHRLARQNEADERRPTILKGLIPLAETKGLGSNWTTSAISRERDMVKKLMLAALVATFAGGAAFAQESCETKAMGKDGKPLAGAAKNSFMKKCMADSCAAKAMSADGKPLSGAAKTSFMKKCEKGA
jgi:uncharacterized protein DUF6691